ncbi:MAG TPA: DUF4232 domain-containing protein [Anaerolineales bacterium]|jgi:hypothetical protein
MKRLALILFLLIFTAGCSFAGGQPSATEPALNFPDLSPTSISRCTPVDLQTSSNFTNADGSIILGVSLINNTKKPCTLSNPPLASLLDADKKQLDLQMLEISPEQTPPAAALMKLTPGESAIVTLIWQNYCLEKVAGDLVLRLELAKDQYLDVGMDVPLRPKCSSKTEPSTMTVAPYSYPP